MIVLDSDFVIDFLFGTPEARALMAQLRASGEELVTTAVNVAELYRGTDPSDATLQAMLDGVLELPLDGPAARRCGSLMRALDKSGRPIPEMDGFVASITLEHGGRIVTGNQRHLGRVAGLQLTTYR